MTDTEHTATFGSNEEGGYVFNGMQTANPGSYISNVSDLWTAGFRSLVAAINFKVVVVVVLLVDSERWRPRGQINSTTVDQSGQRPKVL